MNRFNKILFVAGQPELDASATAVALTLAQEHSAELFIWSPLPDLPAQLENFEGEFHKAVIEKVQSNMQEVSKRVHCSAPFQVQCVKPATGTPLAVAVIQKVLREGFDLVVKASDAFDDPAQKGFVTVDMNLLRQCPCPVWLVRPHSSPARKIAVAIDPNETESAARELSLKLLRVTESLVKGGGVSASIVSCWKLEHEYFLRTSPFGKLPTEEVDTMERESKKSHEQALEKVITESHIDHQFPIHLLKGDPAKLIPHYCEENAVDLLVMGTVARTGIPGFIIGNTAESVVQGLRCSMLAVKPQGFLSPVTV